MRNPAALFRTQLGRPDVQAPVELQRVAVDNFAAEFQGQLDGKVTFSGAGGTHQANQRKRMVKWQRYTL